MAKSEIVLTFEDQRVPLLRAADGTVYVKGTKVALEGIVFAHKRGSTPQEIQWAFDAVSLGDVYSVIGYYLHRTEEVEEYLEEYTMGWDKMVADLMAKPGAREFYARLEKIRRQKEIGGQAAASE